MLGDVMGCDRKDARLYHGRHGATVSGKRMDVPALPDTKPQELRHRQLIRHAMNPAAARGDGVDVQLHDLATRI